MDPASLGLFAAALLVNAGAPGPGIAALVARAATAGVRPVLPFMAAFWVGEIVWLVAAALGLGALALAFHEVFVAVKWLGVLYLVWLAWGMWTRPVGEGTLPRAEAPAAAFLAGLALTMGNPKVMVFYVALLPTLVDLRALTPLGLAELCGVALLVMMAVDLGWALAASQARRWLRTPGAQRLANRLGATAMGGAAAAIAAR